MGEDPGGNEDDHERDAATRPTAAARTAEGDERGEIDVVLQDESVLLALSRAETR